MILVRVGPRYTRLHYVHMFDSMLHAVTSQSSVWIEHRPNLVLFETVIEGVYTMAKIER